jgi:drug/metabolite transporter (DMT)-like permease
MIFFVGCISHAIYAPVVRKVNRGESALVFAFGMLVSGFLILAVYGAPRIVATDWTVLPPIVWITLFYTAIFASAVTSFLLQYAALRLPSAKVMAYTYLTPSWVILWEIALGNGAPTGLVLGGIGLTFVALWMLLKDEGARTG